jgi:DNA-binding XRE family transcriptional regulator
VRVGTDLRDGTDGDIIAGVESQKLTQPMGTRLRHWRRDRKVRQSDLANYMNVSRQTVSRWEHGAELPRSIVLAIKHWDCEHPRAGL